MLFEIINHFFVDGAQHICLAWGVCHPRADLSYITCEECVEGMEWVQAYMTDPLWVAEYTLYLEQVGSGTNCLIDERYNNLELLHRTQPRPLRAAGTDSLPSHARHGHGPVLDTH